MTKKVAWELIEKFKDETNYFSGIIELDNMKEMFRDRMGFGEAETEVILAALTIVGAKFQDDEKEVSEAWKKEKTRKARYAQRLGEAMDQAIKNGDDDSFYTAYQKSLNYMNKKERAVYSRKFREAKSGR